VKVAPRVSSDLSDGPRNAELARLRRDIEALEHASQAQRDGQVEMGLAWTAHELRAPLAGVRAALDLIAKHLHAEPRLAALAESSAREVDRTIDTADALLAAVVRRNAVERHPTDLAAVIRDVKGSCTRGLREDDVLLEGLDRLVMDLDEDLVRVAVANVVRNAIAYRTAGTRVRVRLGLRGDEALVSVHNDGRPISTGERARIFDPFVRGDAAGTDHKGSGLGLFIAKRVAEAHGGSVAVESEGEGTTFAITFPLEGRERRSAS
jgi:signal transduction histidine kinase